MSALVASFLGWTLDAFDFFLVVVALPSIARDFGVDNSADRALDRRDARLPPGGGLHLRADRRPLRPAPPAHDRPRLLLGRRGALGLRAELHVFLVLRALFGIGMGGEWGVGASLAMEKVPPRWRGVLSGFLQEGYAVGYLLAAVCYFFVLPALGLAADVLHRRPAGAARALRPLRRSRSRRCGRARATAAGATSGAAIAVAVAALPLPRRAHDDDELRLARHAGHVPDLPAASTAASARARRT